MFSSSENMAFSISFFLCTVIMASKSRLVVVNGCACPGSMLTYECSVEGGSATVWQGSAFECSNSGDEIVLLHSRFTSGDHKTCNSGAIVGRSLRVEDNYYTSQLIVTVSPELIGRNISCAYDSDDNEEVTVGNTSIFMITGTILARTNCPITVYVGN